MIELQSPQWLKINPILHQEIKRTMRAWIQGNLHPGPDLVHRQDSPQLSVALVWGWMGEHALLCWLTGSLDLDSPSDRYQHRTLSWAHWPLLHHHRCLIPHLHQTWPSQHSQITMLVLAPLWKMKMEYMEVTPSLPHHLHQETALEARGGGRGTLSSEGNQSEEELPSLPMEMVKEHAVGVLWIARIHLNNGKLT